MAGLDETLNSIGVRYDQHPPDGFGGILRRQPVAPHCVLAYAVFTCAPISLPLKNVGLIIALTDDMVCGPVHAQVWSSAQKMWVVCEVRTSAENNTTMALPIQNNFFKRLAP